jgi:hypothetical protein
LTVASLTTRCSAISALDRVRLQLGRQRQHLLAVRGGAAHRQGSAADLLTARVAGLVVLGAMSYLPAQPMVDAVTRALAPAAGRAGLRR